MIRHVVNLQRDIILRMVKFLITDTPEITQLIFFYYSTNNMRRYGVTLNRCFQNGITGTTALKDRKNRPDKITIRTLYPV